MSTVSHSKVSCVQTNANGSMLRLPAGTRPRMVLVGRQTDCDIRPEHPSLSRWHAAFVYGKIDESQGAVIELVS